MHKSWITFLGTVLLLMAVGSSFVRAQTIAISPKKQGEIRIDKSTVTVGDIFTVSPVNTALTSEIRRLPLVKLKNPGTEHNIQKYQVRNRLSQAGYGGHIRVNGEYPLTIQSAAEDVNPDEVSQLIDEYFRKMTDAADARSIHWEFIRDPVIRIFPGEDFSIDFDTQNKIRPGRFAIRGTLTNGSYRKSISLLLDVKITRTVYIAVKHIARGELLTNNNIKAEPRALDLRESQYAVKNLPSKGNPEARRNIRKGSVLLSTMVKKQDIVHTGETVRLLVHYGNIKVQSFGKAIESGSLAETIRVRERESGKILKGTVLNHQTIQIEPMQNL